MELESITHPMEHTADNSFRAGVPVFDPAHVPTALFFGQEVCHLTECQRTIVLPELAASSRRLAVSSGV